MLAYEFHPLAVRELAAAIEHYNQLEVGKGIELARQVFAAIDQVRQHPRSAPKSRGEIRSIVVQPDTRWNYTVHYREAQSCIRVLAIAHQTQQPFYWFGRK